MDPKYLTVCGMSGQFGHHHAVVQQGIRNYQVTRVELKLKNQYCAPTPPTVTWCVGVEKIDNNSGARRDTLFLDKYELDP